MASGTMTDAGLNGQRLHFVGIGGSGMSGLARLCRARGARVTGSDRGGGPTVDALVADGFALSLDQSTGAVPDDADTVVISAAIPYDHPEVVEATRRGVEVIKYAAMLGRLMAMPGTVGVAVAGTHGKSSTTSMLAHTLIQCGLDPSVIVGAHCAQIGGGHRTGGGPLLVAEACEYDRSFHALSPTHGVILNLEADHLDIYDSMDAIVESFATFARRLPARSDDPSGSGFLLIQHESPHRVAVTAGLGCAVETIGFAPQADWQLRFTNGDDPNGSSHPRCELRHNGETVCRWDPPLPGEHMAYNSAAAAVLAHRSGADWAGISDALASFAGLDRRMQRIGARAVDGGTVEVIDDYGHHPTEVDTTLRALRQHADPQRLICVFQPHQHSRTRHLLNQFAVSFHAADLVIVPEIYFVRDSEEEKMSVTSAALVERLRATGVKAMHVHPLEAIAEHLLALARPGDLVVTMGAGDVWKVAQELVETPATQTATTARPAGVS